MIWMSQQRKANLHGEHVYASISCFFGLPGMDSGDRRKAFLQCGYGCVV